MLDEVTYQAGHETHGERDAEGKAHPGRDRRTAQP
jgi:hypothetical protein